MERVEVCAVRNAAEATDLKVKQIRMFAASGNIIARTGLCGRRQRLVLFKSRQSWARRYFYRKWIVSNSSWHGGTFSLTADHSGERIRVSIGFLLSNGQMRGRRLSRSALAG
ncbi:MAG: hypothetical protein E5X58_29730 [Mesorhizobium sp.]|nr:MAG: hypothetical protein E5X58_29730 [Mesorhizobium sp.]